MQLTACYKDLPYECSLTLSLRPVSSGYHYLHLEVGKGSQTHVVFQNTLYQEFYPEIKTSMSRNNDSFYLYIVDERNIINLIIHFELDKGILHVYNRSGLLDAHFNFTYMF